MARSPGFPADQRHQRRDRGHDPDREDRRRHFYASALIRAGESVKTVQAALGHASAVETLETYAGLWPDSEARTRAAVDDLGLRSQALQGLEVPSEVQPGRGRRPREAEQPR